MGFKKQCIEWLMILTEIAIVLLIKKAKKKEEH